MGLANDIENWKKALGWHVLSDLKIAKGLRQFNGLEIEEGAHDFKCDHAGYRVFPSWPEYHVSWRNADGEAKGVIIS